MARIHVSFAYLKGTVPSLEPTGESTDEAKQTVGATAVKSENKITEGKKKEQGNGYFEPAGENKSGPVLVAQRI